MNQVVYKKRWLYFLLVASGVLLSTMDSSMVNVALPAILADFDADLGTGDLVVQSYLMVISMSLVFWGRLSDQFGKGRIYLLGMGLFCCGALACWTSSSLVVLIGYRCLQAVGASMMMAAGPALIRMTFPKEILGKSLGLVGIATSFGLMAGPLVSGYLISRFSWRGLFLVPVPVSIAAGLFGTLLLLKPLESVETRQAESFDWRGGVIWALFVLSVVITLKLLAVDMVACGVALVVSALLCASFFRCENSVSQPILPLHLIRRNYYWTGTVSACLSFGGLFIILILIPYFLDRVLGTEPHKIGLTMMAMPVTLVLFSPLSGYLYDRIGSARIISTAGLVVAAVATISLIGLDSETSMAGICVPLAVLGAGQSIFLSPNSASVLKKSPERYAGITAGVLATARNFGMMGGAGIAGAGYSFFASLYGVEASPVGEGLTVAELIRTLQGTISLAFLLFVVAAIVSLIRNE